MTEPGNGGTIRITTRDLYDRLVELERKVDTLIATSPLGAAQMNVLQSQITGLQSDHEQRIRRLEAWKYALAPTLVLAGASLGLSVLKFFIN